VRGVDRASREGVTDGADRPAEREPERAVDRRAEEMGRRRLAVRAGDPDDVERERGMSVDRGRGIGERGRNVVGANRRKAVYVDARLGKGRDGATLLGRSDERATVVRGAAPNDEQIAGGDASLIVVHPRDAPGVRPSDEWPPGGVVGAFLYPRRS